jgi:hypothetical protein
MAKVYFNMIQAGNITLDDVPEKWRAEVEKLLTPLVEEESEGNVEEEAITE